MNDKAIELLEKISDKFGVATTELYTVLTKQARLDAWSMIAQTVLIGCCYFFLHYFWILILPHCEPRSATNSDYPLVIQILLTFLAVASVVWVIAIIAMIADSIDTCIKGFLNPKAAAIEKILNSFK